MILSNTALFEALDDGRLRIAPEPAPRYPILGGTASPYSTTTVDLRLARVLQVPRNDLAVSIDLRRDASVAGTLESLSDLREIDDEQGFRLDPNRLILGQTLERVSLLLPADFRSEAAGKPCLAARIEGKSSRARFGILIHFTAPTIHAGWDGPITLEIMNLGPAPFILQQGMPICQLILEEVRGTPTANPSQFQGQQMPAGT